MCGIVGLIHYSDKSLLEKMNTAQYHRGPDEGDQYWDPTNQVGIAMRRLAIVDLAEGHQPMSNEDGSVYIVYNGEIFNSGKLRSELTNLGHIFKTHSSDTEVIVHGYEQWGTDVLSHLNGMFAFAIYDIKQSIVFMARDHMGIKPLFFTKHGDKFAFASEIKSLVAAGITSKQINHKAVWQYMSWQCVPAPLTIFDDIIALPAANYLIYDLKTCDYRQTEYWNCIKDCKSYEGKQSDLPEYVRSEVERAIDRWTMSDVPLASSLSGGLDSAIITSVISKSHELDTYTLGFTGDYVGDERGLSRQLADRYKTRHHEIEISPDDLLDCIDDMLASCDAPYGGGIPTWFIMQSVSGRQKVIFNGLGGDELFGNYYKWMRYESILGRLMYLRRHLAYGESLSEVFRYPNGSIYNKYMPEHAKKTFLLNPGENSSFWVEDQIASCPSSSWRNRIPYIDFKLQLPEEFLMMVDRFSMNFSVEARTPFLDRELVEKMLGIPARWRTKPFDGKYLAKAAFGDLLPDDYLSAPKRGFIIPYRNWLHGRLKEDIMELCSGNFIRNQGIFDSKIEEQLIQPYYRGKEILQPLVWTVYMFQRWWNLYSQ